MKAIFRSLPRNHLSTSAPVSSAAMSWNEFFRLKSRMVWFKRLAGGVPATCAFLTAQGALLSLPIFDPTQPIFGADPLVVVGLGTVAGSVASFFIGSALIGSAWRFLRPQTAAQFDILQRNFYQRIQKHRANVPPNPTKMDFKFDFYGEKVASVQDYRNWLKLQRKSIKERQFNL